MSQRTFRNESRDDYLEAILIIRQKKGFCRSTDIASWLGISRPSVSVELGKLAELGLIREKEACSMEHALSNDSFEKILARYPSGAPEA